MKGELKILGGAMRGMKLFSPPEGITRPLRSLMKKSLFDILGPDVEETNCLDLFSGSGSIGLEAISRGAASCMFVEIHAEVFRVLQKNVDKASHAMDNCEVELTLIKMDAAIYLERGNTGGKLYNLVFLDPPFVARNAAGVCLGHLAKPGWLAEDARIIYHYRKELDISLDDWRIMASRSFGEGSFAILKHNG